MLINSETVTTPYSPELLERNLKSLPLIASSEIEYSKIEKLPDFPFTRYNVCDQTDKYIGNIVIRTYGNNGLSASVTYEYLQEYQNLFEKIKSVWEKYNLHDIAISNAIETKYHQTLDVRLIKIDALIQENLLSIKDWGYTRDVQGNVVIYTVYIKQSEIEKIIVGKYRLSLWIDGNVKAGWIGNNSKDPKLSKMREVLHTQMVMPVLVKENEKKETQVIEPPKPPEPKKQGGAISLWLDWYHAMIDNGYKCTLEDVANKSGYSLGYIKQKHMIYRARPNQNT